MRRASLLSSWRHLAEAACLICLVLHLLQAAQHIPGMAVILDALSGSLTSLVTLASVIFLLLAMSAGLLLISNPQSETLTRIDYLSSFMFVSSFIGAIPICLTGTDHAATMVLCEEISQEPSEDCTVSQVDSQVWGASFTQTTLRLSLPTSSLPSCPSICCLSCSI